MLFLSRGKGNLSEAIPDCSCVGEKEKAIPEAEHSLLPNSCSAKLSCDSPPSVPQYSCHGIWELLTKYLPEAGSYFPVKEVQISAHQARQQADQARQATELCFAKLSCVVRLTVGGFHNN